MAFALSSLLNPASTEDDAKSEQNTAAQPPSTEATSPSTIERRESLPSVNQLLSPEIVNAQLPKYTPPQRPRVPSSSSAIGSGHAFAQLQDGSETRADAGSGVRRASGTYEEGSKDTVLAAEATDGQKLTADAAPTAMVGLQYSKAGTTDTRLSYGDNESDERHAAVSGIMHEDGSTTLKIKKEGEPSPQPEIAHEFHSSSLHNVDSDNSTIRNLTSLKNEYASRTESPLRETSIAIQTTEDHSPAQSTNMKKRPAPAKAKKGTATTAKKLKAPTKKKKVEKPKSAITKGGRSGLVSFSPAPSARSFSADVDDEDEDDESAADSDDDVEGSGDVYCICRKPDNGTFMIGCDGQCDDWFHGKCVGIEERDKSLMSNYICPSCTQAGVGRTSWKRMCRRLGCRQPARVGRNTPKDGNTSKYCSDECGVLFFREMTARTRGAEHFKKHNNRRKSGAANDAPTNADVGIARGGILSAGEVKALIDRSNNANEFKAIGNGVLSPPATPTNDDQPSSTFTDVELSTLHDIEIKKNEARQRHRALKDRLLFVGFVKAEATRAAAAKDLKPKEYCGFDARINWTEQDFMEWRQTPGGVSVFERESLEQLANGTAEHVDNEALTAPPEDTEEPVVCSRKKCARHAEWAKLAVDEIRFEMTDNSNHMRNLEQQEQEIKDQASLRAKHAKHRDEGTVEWHNTTIPERDNDQDIVMQDNDNIMPIEQIVAS